MVSLADVFMVVILVVSQLTYIICQCDLHPWFIIDTQIFHVPAETGNWTEARDHCVSLGADLAQQPKDLEKLAKHIMDKYPDDPWYHMGGYRMGGSDSNNAGEWRWVNGHKIITGWAVAASSSGKAQPNGVGECMSMGHQLGGGNSLSAELCSDLLPFICQSQ